VRSSRGARPRRKNGVVSSGFHHSGGSSPPGAPAQTSGASSRVHSGKGLAYSSRSALSHVHQYQSAGHRKETQKSKKIWQGEPPRGDAADQIGETSTDLL